MFRTNAETGKKELVDNEGVLWLKSPLCFDIICFVGFIGDWLARMVPNPCRLHSMLPSSQFSSDHIALVVDFSFDTSSLCGTWG